MKFSLYSNNVWSAYMNVIRLLFLFVFGLLITNCTAEPNVATTSDGDNTLAGIDSDKDGVRDDVQYWIAINHSNSEKIRMALTQIAKVNQRYILNASDPVLSKAIAREVIASIDCLVYVSPVSFNDISIELESIFFNTYERSKARAQADHHSSGTVFGSGDPKQGCDFDPDLLPN